MEHNTLKIIKVQTNAYFDQNPGTSGLRKKVTHFQQTNYLENFVQSVFFAHNEQEYKGKSIVIGGDGRYYNDKAINTCIKICAGNGIKKVILAENGLMSTPAVSLKVRNLTDCFGAIVLTASHNPGGQHEDFGIKFNNSSGAPAPENITSKIFENTKILTYYNTIDYEFSINQPVKLILENESFEVEIESSTSLYISLMKELFDFNKIQILFDRKDFSFIFDAMHGASGPYAIEIFHNIFKVPIDRLFNCNTLPDFGGIHPDPNLVHAHDLVEKMKDSDFGAACDGDADRNMILGRNFFVSPSDSIAIIAANHNLIPSLKVKGVARSMPTSSALDRVANKLGIKCYETPTGWKFFGNLMDAGLINLCGEESFGTGSDHIREKDGIWAVLCWLSILAEKNYGNTDKLIGVKEIVIDHWKIFGREYYCRYDYEGLETSEANQVKQNLEKNFEFFKNLNDGNEAYVFEYLDIVDKSVSKNQGWIYRFIDGSRIVFRVSGTSSAGATIRIYFEKHEDEKIDNDLHDMIKPLVEIAMKVSGINQIRSVPTVIT